MSKSEQLAGPRPDVVRVLKTLVRMVLALPERAGHGRRRRRVLARLGGPPGSILVLCHGNICRSPYVAARLRSLAVSSDVRIESAGFLPGGRPAPAEARETARGRGIDLDGHRSRQTSAADLEAAELILVMEPGQRGEVAALSPAAAARVLVLGALDPEPFQRATIPDPWGRPIAEFAACYERLDRCAAALWARIDGRG